MPQRDFPLPAGRPLRVRPRGRRGPPRLRHMAGHEVAPAAGCQRPGFRDPAPDLGAHPAFGTPLRGDPCLAPDALGHPAVRLLRPDPVQHRHQRAIRPPLKGRVRGGGGRPATRHRSTTRPTGASSGRLSPSFATIPSAGPNTRPDGTRICRTPSPSSALRTNLPFSSLSPSSRAPASPSRPSRGVGSGQESGSGSATSTGMPGQKGVRHASTSGFSQTASPHSAAARSARVWTRSGNGAASKRTGPPAPPRPRDSRGRAACRPRRRRPASLPRPPPCRDPSPDPPLPVLPRRGQPNGKRRGACRQGGERGGRRRRRRPPAEKATGNRSGGAGTARARSRKAHPHQRAVTLNPIPCSGGASSFALSRRVASSESSSEPMSPPALGAHEPPAEAVVAARLRQPEPDLRRAGEPVAEHCEAVAEPRLQALPFEIVAACPGPRSGVVGREPLQGLAREQPVLAARRARADGLAPGDRRAATRFPASRERARHYRGPGAPRPRASARHGSGRDGREARGRARAPV